MAKQTLGEKKTAKCASALGAALGAGWRIGRAYTRGGRKHFVAQVCCTSPEGQNCVQWVNYKTGEVMAEDFITAEFCDQSKPWGTRECL